MKKLFLLLFLALFFLITSLPGATTIDTPTNEDENYWRSLVKGKEKVYSNIKTVGEMQLKSLREKIAETSRFRESSEFKFDQLKLRLLTEVFSPYSFRAATREFCFVVKNFIARYNEANKDLKTLSRHVSIFEKMKVSIDSLLDKEMPSDVKASLRSMYSDVGYLNDRIIKTQNELKAELTIFDKGVEAANAELAKFRDVVIIKYMVKWYLVPSMAMYDLDMWKIMRIVPLYHSISQGVPDFYNEWNVLVGSLLGGIFVFLFGWSLLCKFFKREEAKRKVFSRALLWAVAGFVFFAYAELIDFYPRIYFNYFLVAIFFVTSMMYLSWGFQCKEDAPEKKPPFQPMLWIFVYGMILEFTDIYYPALSVLWLLGIVINIFYLRKQMRRNYLAFEKSLLAISYVIYICSILMVLIGLTHLSILVILTWFIICLSVQLGLNVNTSARRIIEHFAGGPLSLLKIIVIGFIAPVVWLIIMVFLYLWVVGQTFGSSLLVADFASITIHGVEFRLGYVIFGVYLFFVFRAISNMTKITVRKLVAASKVESGAAQSISILVSYVLWGVYLVIILCLMGVNLTNLAVVTGGLSVGLGFGLRDIVNNFLSSLIILLGRSIRHGDIIEIDGILGKVLEITIRSTVVQTNNNAIVAVPNSEIISSKLINWTGNNSAVMKEIKVGVSYDSDVEKIKYILLDIAKNTEHVLGDPSPSVVFNEFADSTLNFILNVWVDDIRIASATTSLVREKINAEFKASGIKMAYPQLDIHLN